jgi:hypothetical protein
LYFALDSYAVCCVPIQSRYNYGGNFADADDEVIDNSQLEAYRQYESEGKLSYGSCHSSASTAQAVAQGGSTSTSSRFSTPDVDHEKDDFSFADDDVI